MKRQKTDHVVVIPDLHVPSHDPDSLRAVLAYIESSRVDKLIILGDFMDNDQISHHWKARNVEPKYFQTAYGEGRKVLAMLVNAARRHNKARVVLIEGNHDAWLNDHYLAKHPEMVGCVGTQKLLNLAAMRVEWIANGHKGGSHRHGKMLFTHGDSVSLNHTRKNAVDWGCNIGYGHTHDIQMSTIQQYGRGKVLMAQSHGCLCLEEMPYIGKRPKKWQQGFGIYRFFDDGCFNHYVPVIVNGRFSLPDGRVFDKTMYGGANEKRRSKTGVRTHR